MLRNLNTQRSKWIKMPSALLSVSWKCLKFIDVLRVRKPQALLIVQITVDLYAGLP